MLKNNGTPADTLFASIVIKDSNGNEKYSRIVNGTTNNLWTKQINETNTEEAQIGDTLEIYYKGDKNDISVTNSLTGEVTKYTTTKWQSDKLVFEVTKYGLVLKDEADSEVELKAKFYLDLQEHLNELMDERSSDDLLNPFAPPSEYMDVLASVSKLDDEYFDGAFEDVLKAMTTGESPVITFNGGTLSYEQGLFDEADFRKHITITDNEDGAISSDDAEIETEITEETAPGEYEVTVSVTDRHGNKTIAKTKVIITEAENDRGNHSFVEHEAKAATCTDKGHKQYFTCTNHGCENKFFVEQDGQKVEADWSDIETPALGHDIQENYSSDETHHWHACSRCDARIDEEEHKFTLENQKEPTHTDPGYTGDRVCAICGRKIEGETIQPTGHDTAIAKWQYDATNHWKECSCGDKTDMGAHDLQWVVDKAATATEKGSKHEECNICGYQRPAVEIPATENPGKPPQTGDNNSPVLWFALMLLCGSAIATMAIGRRKKHNR